MSKAIRIMSDPADGPEIWGVGWLSGKGAELLRQAGDDHLTHVAAWLERYGDLGEDGRGHLLVPALWAGVDDPDDQEWVAGVVWLEEAAAVLSTWAVEYPGSRLTELAELVNVAAGMRRTPYIWW
ncbi:hypothetical protein [Streptomyces sp. CA-106110]|uniref:hypothetical protein n=1 Tax=Streptomyces sp. CA-106110 TaxID=3240044 RepID=UPI003D8A5CD0